MAYRELERKVRAYIIEKEMIRRGEHIVLGLSGGADSVCLFRILLALSGEFDLTLHCVHVHHGLRGIEADDDCRFSANLCRQAGVSFRCFKCDVREEAKRRNLSEEEAGRVLRYQYFREAKSMDHADRIAVAHHLDDEAETVLMNLFRGSSLRGLAGIRPVRDDVIRPLHKVTRKEIEAYLKEIGQDYCTDATNHETVYTRNKIRLELLPFICDQINPGAAGHIVTVAEDAARASAYISKVAAGAREKVVRREDVRWLVLSEPFMALDPVIGRELLYQTLGEVCEGLKDLEHKHVDMLMDLMEGQVGRQMDIRKGVRAVRSYDYLEITGPLPKDRGHLDYVPVHAFPAVIRTNEAVITLKIEEFEGDNLESVPKLAYTKWMDYDNIRGALCVRTMISGDTLLLKGGIKKSLRRLMIDEKVPRERRKFLPLLADEEGVLFVPALGRISDRVLVSEGTRRILVAEYSET